MNTAPDPARLGLDTRSWLPDRHDHGIAIVGCGGIVNDGHLPAYTSHGLNVVGCYDINPEAAQSTAERWGVERVFGSLEEVAGDPATEIADIAVPAWRQLELVRTLADSGKHLLCQKPLSDDFAQAVEIVQRAESAGVKLAVNQQYRWSPVVRAMHTLISQGRIGTPTAAFVHESLVNPWELWPWLMEVPQLEIMYHSIHYLDGMRFLLGAHGEPEWVTSRHTGHPLQTPSAETKTVTILDYADGTQAFVAVDHNDVSDDVFGRVRLLGTEGRRLGHHGALLRLSPRPRRHRALVGTRRPGRRLRDRPAGTLDPRGLRRTDLLAHGRHQRRHRAADQRPRQPQHAAPRERRLPVSGGEPFGAAR